ncbi:MAG: hypothetical protein FWF30_03040 [Coriobacteriia bacterium]|nr:hypothetical protein [Coriobacteriia bacterium]
MSYYGYYQPSKPRDPAAQLAKLRKKDPNIQPVTIEGKLAKTWWGMAWNKNLEGYADYANRIGRGRSYARHGAVLDLRIAPGEVTALVQGSRVKPYEVQVCIAPLAGATWKALLKSCSHSIASLEDLVAGRFPEALGALFTNRGSGLFPSPREISFGCSCPDWALMCKHVAAVLYGIGARFDDDPTLFFRLRQIDFSELLKKSIDDRMQSMLKNAGRVTPRVMTDVDTRGLFGV